eukprot:GHVL01034280.1.p1 GENE.GHVL01034280.1~~GHVL01034280.1.p1  ORF type:complete len:355 (+),score=27.23 GHVL01034280.1:38-1102(+)
MFYKSLRDPFAARVEYKDQGGRLFSLEEMYFCDGCSMLYSRFDLTEEIESFYCPHCLDNLPSSEAMLYLARCSKCFECPICFNTLCTIVSHDSSCHLSCFYCRWNSRIVGLEANKAEALITMALQREKDSPRKTEMSEIVNIFRKSSQEMAREKELQARIQRRRRSLGMQFPIVEPRERPKGPWRLDHLESKLKERDDKYTTTDVKESAKKGVKLHQLSMEDMDELTQRSKEQEDLLLLPLDEVASIDQRSRCAETLTCMLFPQRKPLLTKRSRRCPAVRLVCSNNSCFNSAENMSSVRRLTHAHLLLTRSSTLRSGFYQGFIWRIFQKYSLFKLFRQYYYSETKNLVNLPFIW